MVSYKISADGPTDDLRKVTNLQQRECWPHAIAAADATNKMVFVVEAGAAVLPSVDPYTDALSNENPRT